MLAQRQKKPAPLPTVQSITIPAPIGGLNTVDAGAAMPEGDCILLYNMVAAEYGLRTRLGWKEWCTTLGSAVRSVLPFTGAKADGTLNKLFATTTAGIWDCTASSASPTKIVTFGTTTGDAGYGISTVFVNLNGDHFLLYCDEVNGYYTYTSATDTWTHVALATSLAWAPSTAYTTVGPSRVFANGATYKCTTIGTSAATGTGPSGTGTGITDGTAVWAYEPTISGKDPATFAFVTVWGNRVWFVEKDTANAYYTGIQSLYGPVSKFPFGARFKAGGDLRGLFNWTIEGGQGTVNSLVGVSGGGDVVIYQGTDPTQASSFSIKGVWSLGGGGVPAGRRIATDYGGDLLLMSTIGLIPISELTQGRPIFERAQYATQKIANLFGNAAVSSRTLKGWQVRLHPQDNTLMINVPVGDNTTYQFVMSLNTKGWSIYRDLPALLSMESWQGDLYFGTADGRVCKNTGFVDGVTLAAPTVSTPVQFEVLTAFQNGDQKFKRLHIIRPQFLTQGGNPSFSAGARFDYDFSEAAPVSLNLNATGDVWGTGKWGTAKWSGSSTPTLRPLGGTGCGIAAAVIIRGSATSRTSLVGIDIFYDSGGAL